MGASICGYSAEAYDALVAQDVQTNTRLFVSALNTVLVSPLHEPTATHLDFTLDDLRVALVRCRVRYPLYHTC